MTLSEAREEIKRLKADNKIAFRAIAEANDRERRLKDALTRAVIRRERALSELERSKAEVRLLAENAGRGARAPTEIGT